MMSNFLAQKNRIRFFAIFLTIFLAISFLAVTKTEAATYGFVPAASLKKECKQSVDIEIDATGQSSNAADLEIKYNTSEITIVDSDSSTPGVQIKPGNAYEGYFGNTVDTAAGKIRLTAASLNSVLTTKKIFATIELTSKPGVVSTSFIITFTSVGNTYDSNIADTSTSTDLLTSVTNGSYTFVDAECSITPTGESDIKPPVENFIQPVQFGIADLNSNVIIRITDDKSGVDLATVVFTINGINYTVASPEVSYVGTPLDYTFTINPAVDFPKDIYSTIRASAKDKAGNQSESSIVFNIPSAMNCVPSNSITTIFIDKNNISFEGTFLKDSFIDTTVNSLGVSGAGALLTGLLLLLNLFPFLSLLNTPGLLINIISYLFGGSSKRSWGIVTDGITHKPLPFTSCRLYQAGTLYMITQTVTDLEGRYGFSVTDGVYRLEVSKSGYDTFSKEIRVGEYESGYVYDVPLSPKDSLFEHRESFIRRFWNKLVSYYIKLSPVIFLIGLVLAALSLLINPVTGNYVIMAIYIAVIMLYIISKLFKKNKNAAIINSETKLKIPFAIIKFMDPETFKVIDTQITNPQGLFDFWGDEGDYAILVAIRGYTFPSKKHRAHDIIKTKYTSLLKIHLKKGHNNIQIYIDPIKDSTDKNIQTSSTGIANLQNPFS